MNRFFCLAALLLTSSALAIESPDYTVEKKDGNFEVRKYPEMMAAATQSGSENSGFRTLFKFICGNNAEDQKIAMTTPVFMPGDSEGKTKEMMFLVPKDVVASGVPAPKSKEVSIKKMDGGQFAVLQFPGKMDDALRKSKLEELKAKAKEMGLETVGDPVFAGYDGPWKAAAKRRNEVFLRLK